MLGEILKLPSGYAVALSVCCMTTNVVCWAYILQRTFVRWGELRRMHPLNTNINSRCNPILPLGHMPCVCGMKFSVKCEERGESRAWGDEETFNWSFYKEGEMVEWCPSLTPRGEFSSWVMAISLMQNCNSKVFPRGHCFENCILNAPNANRCIIEFINDS